MGRTRLSRGKIFKAFTPLETASSGFCFASFAGNATFPELLPPFERSPQMSEGNKRVVFRWWHANFHQREILIMAPWRLQPPHLILTRSPASRGAFNEKVEPAPNSNAGDRECNESCFLRLGQRTSQVRRVIPPAGWGPRPCPGCCRIL